MRVLITGALGFIGSHLSEQLLAAGHQVVGLDDRSGNVVDAIPGMHCYDLDARDIGKVMLRHLPEVVVHAASPVGAVALLERASIVAEIVETTQAVIHFCRYTGARLVNVSSSEVYGYSGVYRETDECVVSPELTHRLQYAAGKLAAEQLVRTAPIRSLSIRPFNVAGPRQSRAKGFVLPTFCEQALAGEPLTVFDHGDQQRCPTAVWDLCDFIALALEASQLQANASRDTAAAARDASPRGGRDASWARAWDGGVVNVGNPANRTTVHALAELVLRVSGSESLIRFTSGKAVHGPAYEEATGRVKVPDASVAIALGWQPRIGLREMVERTLTEITVGASRGA